MATGTLVLLGVIALIVFLSAIVLVSVVIVLVMAARRSRLEPERGDTDQSSS